jgi:hypothetical protein
VTLAVTNTDTAMIARAIVLVVMVLSVLVAMNSLKPVRQRAVTPSTVGESADDEQRSSDNDNQ